MIQLVMSRALLTEIFEAAGVEGDQVDWNYHRQRGRGTSSCIGIVGRLDTLVQVINLVSMEVREAELTDKFNLDHVMTKTELVDLHNVLMNDLRSEPCGFDFIFFWPKLRIRGQ
jgi:hypothetical protein